MCSNAKAYVAVSFGISHILQQKGIIKHKKQVKKKKFKKKTTKKSYYNY